MSTTPSKPKNYLNNKDILTEIHESKNSYCVFTNPEYHRYDLIVNVSEDSIDQKLDSIINQEIIQQAKEVRLARLNSQGITNYTIDDIKISDLVFRVMTWDHIPLAPKKEKKSTKKKSIEEILSFVEDDEENISADLEEILDENVNDSLHVKLNFPPFQHYKFDDDSKLYCVGKSHWKGDLVDGQFSKDHGSITKKLARMFLMLCDKYALRFNWRGYTYVDEMKASAVLQLTYVGLRFNEAKSQNPFAYYTAAINNSFCRVLNSEKRVQNIRDDILQMNNLNPSWSRQSIGGGSYEE